MQTRVFWTSMVLGVCVMGASTPAAGAEIRNVPSEYSTIQAAFDVSNAGDTIVVANDTYTNTGNTYLWLRNRSGTAASPITITAATPGGVVLDGLNQQGNNGVVNMIHIDSTSSYIVIQGFEIKNSYHHGIGIWGSYNLIIQCNIHHNGAAYVGDYGPQGIFSEYTTTDNWYIANYVHNNGRISQPNNQDHGLYLCGDNELVANNLIVSNCAFGIQVAGYSEGLGVSNMKIYNNTIVGNRTRSGMVLWKTVNEVDIANNIFYGNAGYGITTWECHGSGVQIRNNLFHANPSGTWFMTGGCPDDPLTLENECSDVSFTESGNITTSDPLFVNSAGDWHLQAGSPAIDSGLTLNEVADDYDGVTRPQGCAYDIGAYEHGQPAPLMPGLSFEAEAGQICFPFTNSGGVVSQPGYTADPAQGGAARYRFNIAQAGDYHISAFVDAPDENANSFFVNIDAEPTDPTMIWDIITPTTGIEERLVSWRGTGTFAAPEFNPKTFTLAAGEHTLIIRGREADTLIDRIQFVWVNAR